MGDGDVEGTAHRQLRSGWWTFVRVFGVMWFAFGAGFLAFTALADRVFDEPPTAYHLAVPVMWLVAGAVLLAWVARQPRTVRADPAGVHLDRGRVSFVPWRDILRTQTLPTGLDVHDVWLETSDNRLVRLPSRVPAGTVETWRYELGGEPGSSGVDARSTWARAPVGPAGEAQLPQLILWPYLLSGPLIGGERVSVLLAATAVAVVAAVVIVRRRVAPVRASASGVTLHRFGRTVTVPWADIRDVRARKGYPAARFALVLGDGKEVPLPPGLTAEVVQGWADEHASRRSATS